MKDKLLKVIVESVLEANKSFENEYFVREDDRVDYIVEKLKSEF